METLLRWLREWWRGEAAAPMSLSERVGRLSMGWEVAVEMTWQVVERYAASHGVSLPEAVEDLQAMHYVEALREVGER